MEDIDWYQLAQNIAGPGAGILFLAWLVQRGYLYLRREFEREVKRADDAEARAAKYEDLLLKRQHVMSDAVNSHEEIVEELSEMARRHGGFTS